MNDFVDLVVADDVPFLHVYGENIDLKITLSAEEMSEFYFRSGSWLSSKPTERKPECQESQ